jgi:hypothetical protein
MKHLPAFERGETRRIANITASLVAAPIPTGIEGIPRGEGDRARATAHKPAKTGSCAPPETGPPGFAETGLKNSGRAPPVKRQKLSDSWRSTPRAALHEIYPFVGRKGCTRRESSPAGSSTSSPRTRLHRPIVMPARI